MVIFACVYASMFGFTRTATGAIFFNRARDSIDALQFRFAFGVERINVLPQRKFDFLPGFADAGKDAPARVAAGRDDALQFTAADDVESAAEPRDRPQHGEIRIGFDGEADEMVHGRHRGVELLEMFRQRALRIDVKRRAEFAARATRRRRLRRTACCQRNENGA